MANVRELLLPCYVQHVIDHGWKILLTHLVKGELPELLSGRIENCVLSAVSVSSEVAHPHIIASVRENETCQAEGYYTYRLLRIITNITAPTKCLVSCPKDPVHRGAKQPMLKEDHRTNTSESEKY